MDDLKGVLDRIESDLARLKLEYDYFFQGLRRTEPIEEKKVFEETVRRMGQRRIINTLDQFRFNAVQSRLYSFINLWARTVRDIEEGRMVRDDAGVLVAAETAAESAREEPVSESHLEEVIDRLRNARTECGLAVEETDVETMRDGLLARARKIAAETGKKTVEFKVSVENGKPKIRAVPR